MSAEIRHSRWSCQECCKERMLSETLNAEPVYKPIKYAPEHGSHMRGNPIFNAGKSGSKNFTRRFLQAA
jgi:hypothetical protein